MGYLLLDTLLAAPRGLLGKRGRRLAWANLYGRKWCGSGSSKHSHRHAGAVLPSGPFWPCKWRPVLKQYGAVEQTANIISIAVFRELGPLVSAIVLTGFAGASIAAEIGTMVVSEEIEALEAEAISPIRFLVLPRVVATTIMMVCVAVVGDLTGVFGGGIVGRWFLGMSGLQYFHRTFEAVHVHDFITGLIKAAVFGALISGLACFLGLRVTGGAQGVGVATTRTVVLTIVALILVDLLFTAMFYFYGW